MNPYKINTSEANIRGPIISLGILYNEMPETVGCEKCTEINKDNAIWCCKKLNPSMYYVEFLYAWEQVQKWSKEKRLNLIGRSIKNYLKNSTDKGCVFYEDSCTIRDYRPFACREYGIIPDEGWNERVAMGKKRFGDTYNPIPQCTLVSTVSGVPITKNQEDLWFKHTKQCETRLGIDKRVINSHDDANGSYRTFHDHILLEIFNDRYLHKLTEMRLLNLSESEIEDFVNILLSNFSQNE